MGSQFTELITEDVDADDNSNTEWLDIGPARFCTLEVINKAGAHNNHIVRLQQSTNQVKAHPVTGPGVQQEGAQTEIEVSSRYVRGRVTTPEGEASTIDIIIQAK